MCKRLSPAHRASFPWRALAGWLLIALGILGFVIEQVIGEVLQGAALCADLAITLGSLVTSGPVPILSGVALILIGLVIQRDDWES